MARLRGAAALLTAFVLFLVPSASAASEPIERISFTCTFQYVELIDAGTEWWANATYHVRGADSLAVAVQPSDPICEGAHFSGPGNIDLGGPPLNPDVWGGIGRVESHLVLASGGGFDVLAIVRFQNGPDYYAVGMQIGQGFGDWEGWQLRGTGYRLFRPIDGNRWVVEIFHTG